MRTAYPQPCPGGDYCGDNSGAVTGRCDPGYYCVQNNTVPRPVNVLSPVGKVIGDACPAGSFCPQVRPSPSHAPFALVARTLIC